MSQNVEFILSLEDKQFTASIDRAGKLLTRFGEQVTKPAQKIQTFERSLGSVARIIGVLESKLDSTADKLQDVAAGFELASDATRKMRGNITSLNSGLKTLIERVDTTTSSVDKLTASLRKVQSELNDFSDWATYASKSASRFGTEVKEASASVSGMNTRLNTTTKRLSNWGVTTSQAAEGLKKVREQMDEVIGRQQLISKPVRVRTSGSGDGGSGRRSGASGHSGKSNEGGMFSGLRGNIFLLGEIGDAARTVTDIMFGWQKPIVEAAAEMERMRVMLRGLNKEKSNPGQAAADDMKYIVDMAKSAPFAMEALTDSFVKFRSAGLDPTDGSLKTLVDSVARFGGDSELLKRASIAIQQMSGKGVVSMEELRQQLGEAIPTAMNAMAKAAGLTMGELTKAVASGTVEAKNALALMFKELKMQNEGAASEMMNTFTGTLAQMQTAFTLFADKVGQAGYLSSLKEGMKELTSLMNSTDGMSFAHSLGSGLTTAVDGLRDLAMWLIKNQELVIAFGKVVAAMVAFKLLKAGISGVIGTASQMTSAFANMSTTIQGTFNLASTAVKRFNRAASMGLSPIPSLIFAIRNAFSGLVAFMAANPIGFAFTAAVTAVSSLIFYMQVLRGKIEDVVNKVREIPEAMTAADRAMLESAKREKDRQISKLEKEVTTGKRSQVSRDGLVYETDVDVNSTKQQLENLKKERDDIAKTLGEGIEKSVYKSVTKGLDDAIAEVNQKANVSLVANAKELEQLNKKNEEIAGRTDLSDHEKSQLRAANNAKIERLYSEADLQKLKGYQDIQKGILNDLVNLNEDFKKATTANNTEQLKEIQARIDAQIANKKSIEEQIENVTTSLSVKAGSGLKSINGGKIGEFSSTPVDANSKTMTGFWKQQMDSKRYQRVNLDGTALYDLQGQPVVGPRQLKEQLRQKKIYGDVKLEQLSENDRIAVIKTLTKARELDAEAADKAANRTAKAAERAAKKEQAAQQKLAAGYQKALDKADQLMGQMGESSKATVSFDQSLRDVTKSLTDLANATPNEFISQEMVDQAKKRLADLRNATPEYSEMFNRRNVEQMISAWAPESDSIISAGLMQSHEEKAAEFSDTYNRNLKALIELRDKATDPKIISLYNKQLNQLVAAGNNALIKQTGTATQQLALEYENLAEQIEGTWTDLFSGLTDTLTDFVVNGKMSFSSLATSILKDITNMVVKTQITLPLMNMLGMGTTNAGNAQSGNLMNSVASAIANQGVQLGNSGGSVANGDKSVGEATKETASGVNSMGQASQNAASGLSQAVNGVWDWTKSLFTGTDATKDQTKAVNSSILSMGNLSTAAGALAATFAMVGASSSSSSNRWLNFGLSLASTAVSAWAGSSTPSGSKPNVKKHANGGIFGREGVVPLRAYQKGGIATSPQLAMFGEGSMNEAYVPLPDGRTIPVTLSAESAGKSTGNAVSPVSIQINVTKDGRTSESSSGSESSLWNGAARQIKSIVLETIAEEKRSGGSLNPHTTRG
ncbi:tape measure protein (plasmid) [Escherichia coli O9:H10]|uniref:tape measure protein n=1 Tax=Escherichia coli TaxID=562 RepID=UPI00189D6B1D|nr:tape measure protein [Escherichia coli]EFO1691116.1 phage tail tape measure protein [Escherichia coli]EHI0927357.1 tape measure protein [Escherichia coli]QPE46712.1 tape measure protein [Escherichia coli O9:H10]QPE50901.1 tape measure protein [Escherichia coli O9:H10]HAX1761196.1 tape measure protein [Escherichia coli]